MCTIAVISLTLSACGVLSVVGGVGIFHFSRDYPVSRMPFHKHSSCPKPHFPFMSFHSSNIIVQRSRCDKRVVPDITSGANKNKDTSFIVK